MSIETLTGDEFATLSCQEHDEALELYDQAISRAAQELVAFEANYDDFAQGRDRLGRLLSLRKVHQVRRDELLGEEPAPRLASQQYFDNELDQLPS